MAEVWTDWENVVVNGVFPLRRFLNKSDHSVVFLTDAQNHLDTAIKLIPADPVPADAQISHLRAIAALAHPHLIRLLDVGHCQLGGHPFLFVVMEYAEQTLDQILIHRALTPDEVREMLPPALDALTFLHRNNLVHGGLKPQNFLVVDDQLKLSSDTIRLSGKPAAIRSQSLPYDPPETKDGAMSPAGDIWSLGITLMEALTQRAPEWPDPGSGAAALPNALPAAFLDTVRRCLSRNPADRPRVADLAAQFNPAAPARVVPEPPPVRREAPRPEPPTHKPIGRPSTVAAIAVVLMVAAAVVLGWRLFQRHPASEPSAASATQDPFQQAPAPTASSQTPQTSTAERASALHEEIPDVPRRALASIRGHIKVALRVTVDRSGNVVAVTMKDPGSSEYFARVATTAAGKWKFSPADHQESREWLLRFEFTRSGTTGSAIPQS